MKAGILLLLGGVCLVQPGPVIAGQVTVTNYSFETPAGPVGFNSPGSIPGWQLDFATAGAGSAGISVTGSAAANMDGQQVLNMSVDGSGSLPTSARAYATASNLLTIDSNTTYIVTVRARASGIS